VLADSATRRGIIETVLTRVREAYVLPEVAADVDQALRTQLESGAIDHLHTLSTFAADLTLRLREISHDRHFHVIARDSLVPDYPNDGTTPSELLQERAERGRRSNFGFTKIEVLAGNIGMLRVDSFDYEPEPAMDTVAAAMSFVAHTRALIVDLRANHGGEPTMVQLLASYFFPPAAVQLSSIFWRSRNARQHFWTHADLAGTRYTGQRKVYLLTSSKTYSAAEQFCYDLQQLGRAAVIGERTGGAAHPVWPYRIHEHVELWLPSGCAVNPISHTNWEQTGVKPAHEVTAEQALEVALRLARPDGEVTSQRRT
jgi:hypothetical protein